MTTVATAIRNVRRAPSFAALVVLTLGLGIGATTAMFSVVDAILLNPLPVPHAERFVEIWTAFPTTRMPGASTAVVAPLRETGLLTAVEAYQFGSAVITGGGDPDNVASPLITRGLLDLMGAVPLRGRLFDDADAASAARVILISERFWRSRFGADPAIIDKEITLNDAPHRVAGVLPERFRFPERNVDVWRPLDLRQSAKPMRAQIVGVRKPDVTREQLNDRLQAISPGLRNAGVLSADQSLSTDVLLQQRFGRQVGSPFYILFGAVSLVLLVACVNVTNLMLVRSSARHGELALRAALGAPRRDLVSTMFAESVLLAIVGGLAGLALARLLLLVILANVPPPLMFLSNAVSDLDWRALGFAAVVSLFTCVLFGVLPAWRTSRVDAIDLIKRRAMTTSGSRDDRWQAVLVSAQLALVVVLLAGAGVLLRSFTQLLDVDPGFDSESLAVVSLQMPPQRYNTPGASMNFIRDLEARVESRGNVRATYAGGAPPTGGGIAFIEKPEAEGGVPVELGKLELPFARVAPDYFETMGIPILQGRAFRSDDPDTAAIVNDIMARRFWGDTSPVGLRFRWGPKQPWSVVVGVVGDVKQMGPSDPMGQGMDLYFPIPATRQAGYFAFITRSSGDHAATLQMVRERIWEIDSRLPIVDAHSMDHRIGESLARPRFFLSLASAFAGTAVLLAAIGVYGVATYWVTRRQRELAIRIAVGASRTAVRSMVFARGLRLVTAGAVVGLGLAFAGARVIESLLFQTPARDPLTFIVVTVSLAVLAMLACTWPALKAGRVDPMTILRAE